MTSVVAEHLGKSYGSTRAVDDLSFTIEAGRVTGFLGPNGAGKSTAMRLMLGVDRGEGSTLYDGRPLVEHPVKSAVVGAHLDARSFHPRRSSRDHLRLYGIESGVSQQRVDEVMDLVGLQDVAGKDPGTFSLGMGQRLGLAAAILAEPRLLMLDEPANGLDPQSIHWLRDFLRAYAAEGRAVFVSSHLLSEMQLLADDLVIIASGRMKASGSMADFVAANGRNHVRARAAEPAKLRGALEGAGLQFRADDGTDAIRIDDVTTDEVGGLAFRESIQLLELTSVAPSLEDAFLDLTSDSQGYAVGGGTA